MASSFSQMAPRGLALAPGRTPPRHVTRAGVDTIEAIFSFETSVGPYNGVVRLISKAGGQRAWTLMTTLDEIRGNEGPANGRPLAGMDWKRNFGGENWLDRRKRAQAYADRDPAVLVVGAAQAGLPIAARLTLLGVDTLVVDREARIGDSWRHRYHALTLHNETRVVAARRILRDEVGDRMGPVWGFDGEGELQAMWQPTGQQGLWFLAGGPVQCRIFSKALALHIKARELGITA